MKHNFSFKTLFCWTSKHALPFKTWYIPRTDKSIMSLPHSDEVQNELSRSDEIQNMSSPYMKPKMSIPYHEWNPWLVFHTWINLRCVFLLGFRGILLEKSLSLVSHGYLLQSLLHWIEYFSMGSFAGVFMQ